MLSIISLYDSASRSIGDTYKEQVIHAIQHEATRRIVAIERHVREEIA